MTPLNTVSAGVACRQIGAREHYAIPRALSRRGLLNTLLTDVWAGPVQRGFGFGPFRSIAARFHAELPRKKVVSFNSSAVCHWIRGKVCRPTSIADEYRRYVEIGQAFGTRVARHLVRSSNRPQAFFGYNTGCLEPLNLMNSWGIPSFVDQIDPARVEEEIVRRECEMWPGWAVTPGRIPEEYFARLSAEWSAASTVVVNSDWSRDALIAQGVPPEKLIVLPLAYELPDSPSLQHTRSASEFTILWLGQVILRKGIQYLLEAVRLLRSSKIRVEVAGRIGISERAVASAPPNVRFLGSIPRSEVGDLYRRADVFVLPTMSDGFAITQLEAMTLGLPVVTTPNCGRVVTDGHDGRVIPAGDPVALAAALDALIADRPGTREMGERARLTAREFSIDRLANRLEQWIAVPIPT